MELLGDATLVSVRLGEALVAVRAAKDFRIDIGAPLHIAIPTTALHLFRHRNRRPRSYDLALAPSLSQSAARKRGDVHGH